jgi:folate-dependent phosphoribosylglycinamide formyltransferase PurN
MPERERLLVMLSGSGRTLLNLVAHARRGVLGADVAGVVAGRECLGAQRAREAGIATRVMPGRLSAAQVQSVAAEWRCGWIVLAGYLQMVPMVPGFEGRVVNIHPALLPAFGGPGMHGHRVHEAVLRTGCRVSGCTVHLCDERYDTGPIVAQRSCPVLPGDTPETLAARVFVEECVAYPQALAELFERARADAVSGGPAGSGR